MDLQGLVTPGVVVAVGFFLWREIKGLAEKVARIEGALMPKPWDHSDQSSSAEARP